MELPEDQRANIAEAMQAVRARGLKDGGARKLRKRIWEVRVEQEDVIHRVTFASVGEKSRVLLSLDAFTKKSRKTPPAKIELAEQRLADWEARGEST